MECENTSVHSHNKTFVKEFFNHENTLDYFTQDSDSDFLENFELVQIEREAERSYLEYEMESRYNLEMERKRKEEELNEETRRREY
jgi:hypothetical protein